MKVRRLLRLLSDLEPSLTHTSYPQLTTIKNLLGRQGGHFLIFGLLTRMEDGELYLEDLDDKVKLDLSDAVRLLSLALPG